MGSSLAPVGRFPEEQNRVERISTAGKGSQRGQSRLGRYKSGMEQQERGGMTGWMNWLIEERVKGRWKRVESPIRRGDWSCWGEEEIYRKRTSSNRI